MKRPIKKNETRAFHSEESLSDDIFSKITSKRIMAKKQFSKTIKPFLRNKRCLENNDIILLDSEEMITHYRTLAKYFNEHYINSVKRCSGFKPFKMSFSVKSSVNHYRKSIVN